MGTVEVMQLPSAQETTSKGFDYRGMRRYLVTMPTYRGEQVFLDPGRITAVLNVLRDSAREHQFDVYAYCFLPDRLVVLVHGATRTSDLRAFLPAFRSMTSGLFAKTLGHPLWKRSYLERVLTRSSESSDVARQVFRLPVGAGLARTAESYPHLGSFTENVEHLLRPRPLRRAHSRARTDARRPRRPR